MDTLKSKVPHIKLNKKVVQVVGLIVLALVVSLISAASLSHLNQLQNQKQAQIHAEEVAAKQVEAVKQVKLARADKVEATYSNLHVECEKGLNVYNNVLTPNQKLAVQKTKSVPVCGPTLPLLK